MNQKTLDLTAWSLVVLSISLAVISWGNGFSWNIESLNAYQWFPLFGLVAWMTMWGHYIIGASRIKNKGLQKPKYYSTITGYIVLASLLLHPGILAYEQKENGQGLPPDSFIDYAGQSLKLAVFIGTLSLFIFLSYEIFSRMKKTDYIKKVWPVISVSQSLAMILIFVHGLRLGSNLGSGWFRIVWIIYGLALIPCFYIIHKQDFEKQ